MPEPEVVDLLVVGASELATPVGSSPRTGAAMNEISVLAGAAIAIRDGVITAVEDEATLRARVRANETLDARGGVLVPGFVDAHTHPVFAGTREEEFELRTRGATYVEISEAGGGILSTVKGVRATSAEVLTDSLTRRLDRFLCLGTTTVEAKSGYGLSLADEAKSLEVIRDVHASHAVDLVSTFLGAHDFPPEYRERKAEYVDLLVEEMLPDIAERSLAEYCDIFTESHVFGLDDSRRILETAKSLGLRLRLHVDQLTPLGGAELAAELGADSADHLEHVSEAGMESLRDAGVVAVLCPLVPLYLRQEREVPGRAMIDRGVPVALATDFNPGSCYTQSMPEVLTWGALRLRMSAAECLTAATLNAACSLGRGAEIGSLEVGKAADIVVIDAPNHLHLVYEFGWNPVRTVIKNGRVVHDLST